jgi:hypothetical protein
MKRLPKRAYEIKGDIDSGILFYAGVVLNKHRKVFEHLAK